METAFNSRVNQLYTNATASEIKVLGSAIKQLKNDPTQSSAIVNSDDITEGSVNLFHSQARINSELGSLATNIVPDGNVTRSLGSAANKFNSVFTATVTGLNTPTNNDDAATKAYVDANSGTYSNASVDTHLNVSGATNGQTLIWNGSDYSWGTPASGYTDSDAISAITGSSLNMGSNDITTTGKILFANVYGALSDLPSASTYHGMFAHVHATGKGYLAHGGAWHQLLDKTSANDSATITNLANSVLTAKAITNTTLVGDSATITNIANSVLTAKAITGTSATIDSATIGNIAITNAVISSGDSATFTNIANTQFTGSQATIDSADIGNLRTTGVLQTDSVNTVSYTHLTLPTIYSV